MFALPAVLVLFCSCRTLPAEMSAAPSPASGMPVTSTVTPSASPVITPGSTPTGTAVTGPLTTSIPADSSPAASPLVLISYTTDFVLERSTGNYLVVTVSIQNFGYDSFSTDPACFSVTVNNAKYTSDPGRTDLRSVILPNGGKINGKLVFRVPQGAASGSVNVSMKYVGIQPYNVHWIKRA
jgi:hypothetical protein